MKVVIHQSEIVAMMSPTGEIGRGAMRAAGRVRDRGKEGATVSSGLMKNSIIAELQEQGLYSVTWRIGSNVFYAIYQELGTGPIYARRAPLLVFKVGGHWVSTYSTRGVPAVLFLTKAIERTSTEDFR